MKSKRVTCTWEFYRDNCDGFKEPMRKELRKLDGYVSSIEAENAELRELVRDEWLQLLNAYDRKELDEFAERMKELGVETDG